MKVCAYIIHGFIYKVLWRSKVAEELKPYGFNMDVVESVNVSDDIKTAGPLRDEHIKNYIQTIRNLAPFGVKVICYNFMPVFDWTRTDLFHQVKDEGWI